MPNGVVSTRQEYLNRLEPQQPHEPARPNVGTLEGAKQYVINKMSEESKASKRDRIMNANNIQELAAIAAQHRSRWGGETRSLKALAEYLTDHKVTDFEKVLGRELNRGADGKAMDRVTQRGLRHLAAYGEYRQVSDNAEHTLLEKRFEKDGADSREGYLVALKSTHQADLLSKAKEYLIRNMSKASLGLKAERIIAAQNPQELAAIAAERRTGSGETSSLNALMYFINREKISLKANNQPFEKVNTDSLRYYAITGQYNKTLTDDQRRILNDHFAAAPGQFKSFDRIPILRNITKNIQNGNVVGGVIRFHGQPELIIEKTLGTGANGAVYQCKDQETGRIWAVKEIKVKQSHVFVNDHQLPLNEINNMRAVDHKNIAGYVNSARSADKKTIYIVMEYIHGEELDKKNKNPTDSNINKWSGQLIDAMQAKTDAKQYVLDLKPANVMISAEGNLKVIDQGCDICKDSPDEEANTYEVEQRLGGELLQKDEFKLPYLGTPLFRIPEVLNLGPNPDIEKVNVYATCINLALMRLGLNTASFLAIMEEAYKKNTDNEGIRLRDFVEDPERRLKVITELFKERFGPIDQMQNSLLTILDGMNPNPEIRPTLAELKAAFNQPQQ